VFSKLFLGMEKLLVDKQELSEKVGAKEADQGSDR